MQTQLSSSIITLSVGNVTHANFIQNTEKKITLVSEVCVLLILLSVYNGKD